MSAGKQLHPFFSSRKGGKKNQEAAKENGSFQEQGKDQIGPIHVFERFQVCCITYSVAFFDYVKLRKQKPFFLGWLPDH